jgi:hypothetical protein
MPQSMMPAATSKNFKGGQYVVRNTIRFASDLVVAGTDRSPCTIRIAGGADSIRCDIILNSDGSVASGHVIGWRHEIRPTDVVPKAAI